MKFVIFRSAKDDQFYFRIVADNNEIVAQSEGYEHQSDCEATAELIKDNVSDATIEVRG